MTSWLEGLGEMNRRDALGRAAMIRRFNLELRAPDAQFATAEGGATFGFWHAPDGLIRARLWANGYHPEEFVPMSPEETAALVSALACPARYPRVEANGDK